MMENEENIISRLYELEETFNELTDVDTLLELYQNFDNERFEFLNPYYKSQISERIVNMNIPLKEGDFFCAIYKHSGDVGYYQFIEAFNYFENFRQLQSGLKSGFTVRGVEFLKSGKLPKRKNWGNFIRQNEIVKILRGASDLNEKTIYKKLQLSEEDLALLKKEVLPIIIDYKSP